MQDLRLLLGCTACGLVGLGLGLWLGRPALPPTAPTPASATSPPPADCPACPACPELVCADDLAATELPPVQPIVSGVGPGEADPPTPWPADLPAHLSPEVTRAALEDLAEACGFAPDLQTIDCQQPPCMAVVLTPEGVEPPSVGPGQSCPQWTERFGASTATSSSTVLCADGSRRILKVVGPHSEELDALIDRPEPDPEDPFTSLRAFQQRIDQIGDDLGCGEPGMLTIENRAGHTLKWFPSQVR